jgi:hypothetical protein
MIMNKKIFTLLMGVILAIGSAFTASAQTPTVHDKLGKAVAFADTLRTEEVDYFVDKNKYVIRLSGIANASSTLSAQFATDFKTTDYVLFVDAAGQLRLDTLATLDFGDYKFSYQSPGSAGFSSKIAAIRRASWCVQINNFGTTDPQVPNSNLAFNFINVHQNEALEAPLPGEQHHNWNTAPEGYGRQIYDGYYTRPAGGLKLGETGLIVSNWHFSQTAGGESPSQPFQKAKPIYAYIATDTVLVLVIDAGYIKPTTTSGGWVVTLKKVAVKDLIDNSPAGNVVIGGSKPVNNVLLFSLAKINEFVLNSNDYNAVSNSITFTDDASTAHSGADLGWNPFTSGNGGNNPHGHGRVKAVEVYDSLYRYGYLQFQQTASPNNWLVVDTGFWNIGNDQFLRFKFEPFKRDSNVNKWGATIYDPSPSRLVKPDSVYYISTYGDWNSPVYWRLDSLVWAVANYIKEFSWAGSLINGDIINQFAYLNADAPAFAITDILPGGQQQWEEIVAEARILGYSGNIVSTPPYPTSMTLRADNWISAAHQYQWATISSYFGNGVAGLVDFLASGVDYTPGNSSTKDYAKVKDAVDKFHKDSAYYVDYLLPLYSSKDSLMENQSKFRVVYDPFEVRTVINVYQTRYQYQDFTNPLKPVAPDWWTNSFRVDNSGNIVRPSDIWNSGSFDRNAGYYRYFYYGDVSFNGTGWISSWSGLDKTTHNFRPRVSAYDSYYHTFMDYYEESSPKKMDKVLISTADTSVFFVNSNPLSWQYGYNGNGNQVPNHNGQGVVYRDSLFYIGIQNTGGSRIATLIQSDKIDETKITLYSEPVCKPVPPSSGGGGFAAPTIKADLYLIRNNTGQFLAVPIWSITDSVYWITPEGDEDPTQTPSYQWVLEYFSTDSSVFKLTNREFENVVFPYNMVSTVSGVTKLRFGGQYSASRLNALDYVRNTNSMAGALGKGSFVTATETQTGKASFIPLKEDVKTDNLLGYTYVDPDATVVDVYAFKHYNFIATKYLGWNGYDNAQDTVVRVNYEDYTDKLYFALEQMPRSIMGKDYVDSVKVKIDNASDSSKYMGIIQGYMNNANNSVNRDGLLFEKFGYYSADMDQKNNLKPLLRQAYRLLLKDYYMFSPFIDGSYMTVGQQDNYILADKAYASRKYQPNQERVEGLFGIPYYYFRNTYFGLETGNKAKEDPYFALIQRIDTLNPNSGTTPWADVNEYITSQWGVAAAEKITAQIQRSRENGVFIALVEDATAKLKLAIRGDAAIRASTFTLEKDNDPLYRRFHWNDYFDRTKSDEPLTLEFHRLNNSNEKLFENSGADKRTGGGYEYNLIDVNNPGKGLKADVLGNTINFLGFKNIAQFPKEENVDGYPTSFVDPKPTPELTNYSFYVDTAFVNRGTGWIKPQYMIAVDTLRVPWTPLDSAHVGCITCGSNVYYPEIRPYVIGRYLYNTSMYAKVVDGTADYDKTQPIKESLLHGAFGTVKVEGQDYVVDGKTYTEGTKWERLAFAWAIHRGDSLYVLNIKKDFYDELKKNWQGDPQAIQKQLLTEYPSSDKRDINWAGLTKTQGNHTIWLRAIVNLNDNKHKDWVFSFRYIERRADDFIIESETTERNSEKGLMIRPGYGGWVKWENGVPVITRVKNAKELLVEGEIMNVTKTAIAPVGNEKVASATSAVTVVGGVGNVSILNAAGKRVVISNILGQTIANTVLSSDNASIAVPKGIVVVAVAGENAVKAVVK